MGGWRGLFGCFEYGVIQSALGPDIGGPELVAAVANHGCLGFLRTPDWDDDPEAMRTQIRKTKALTKKPFGVGVILAFPYENNLKVILEEKVPFVEADWGFIPEGFVDQCHAAGAKVIQQVASFDTAVAAIEAGVDGLIVQGVEAGGHIQGLDGLMSLLPRVVDVAKPRGITVIAAGGIADERGYAASLALGADGIAMGTRFVATHESYAHPKYKQLLVEVDNTEYGNVFGRCRWPNAAHRTLALGYYWRALPPTINEKNQPVIGHTTIFGRDEVLTRYAGTAPNQTTTGEIEHLALFAGQSVALVKEILPAGEVIKRIVTRTRELIEGGKI